MDIEIVAHREALSQQPLQQASMLQTDVRMQGAAQLTVSHAAQGSLSILTAPGTPAHHSMQVPASTQQYQHPKPWPASAQVLPCSEAFALIVCHVLCAVVHVLWIYGAAARCATPDMNKIQYVTIPARTSSQLWAKLLHALGHACRHAMEGRQLLGRPPEDGSGMQSRRNATPC